MPFPYSASNFRAQRPGASRAELAVGTEAPNFSVLEADGGTVELAALRGKPVLLIFFRRDW